MADSREVKKDIEEIVSSLLASRLQQDKTPFSVEVAHVEGQEKYFIISALAKSIAVNLSPDVKEIRSALDLITLGWEAKESAKDDPTDRNDSSILEALQKT